MSHYKPISHCSVAVFRPNKKTTENGAEKTYDRKGRE